MKLADLRRRLQRLQRQIAPSPPPAPLGEPRVVFMMPWNNHDTRGPGRYRTGDIETWLYLPEEAAADPQPLSLDGLAAAHPVSGAGE